MKDTLKNILVVGGFVGAALAVVVAGAALAVLATRTLGAWAGVLLIASAALVVLAAIALLKNETKRGL